MQQHEQALDIKFYLAKIVRRKYVALSLGLAVLSFFTWGSFLLPKTYEASTTLSIEMDPIFKPFKQDVGTFANEDRDRIQNLKNEITAGNFVEKIVKKLGMDAHAKTPEQYDLLIENIKKKIDVKKMNVTERGAIERPTMFYFKISYTGGDPKTVTQVVDTITNLYIDEHMKSRRAETSKAYELIQNQVLEFKNKLNRLQVDTRMRELMRKREDLRKQLSGEKDLTVAIVPKEGSPQERLNTLNNRLIVLMTKYTENYPEVLKVKAEIEELKKLVPRAKDSHMEGSSESSALNPIYQQIRDELAKTEYEIESFQEQAKLQGDMKAHQQVYDQLLQKLEDAKVSKEIETRDKVKPFRIVDPAKLPLFPVKPNRILLILLGIFFGISSGIGVVFALDYHDHSFQDEDSIETSLKLPVLATIPKIVTEAEEISAKRLERKVFIASGAYLALIGFVFIREFISRYMGINIISF